MRRTVFLIASVLVSALFLYLALRGIPLDEIATSLQQANLAWIVVALVMGSLGLWTRGLRWRGLLQNRINRVEAFYMLSVAMLLRHSLDLPAEAQVVEKAASEAVAAGLRTADIAAGGPALSTRQAGDEVVKRILQ